MSVAQRLTALGVHLHKPAAPVANYVGIVRTGNLLYVSGQLPLSAEGKMAQEHTAKLKFGDSLHAAQSAARICVINVLAQLQTLVDLESITRVVRLGGFFNVDGGHEDLPGAMNGASDFIVEVLGERGRHARTTVGVAHLPRNAICEVEAIFEIAG